MKIKFQNTVFQFWPRVAFFDNEILGRVNFCGSISYRDLRCKKFLLLSESSEIIDFFHTKNCQDLRFSAVTIFCKSIFLMFLEESPFQYTQKPEQGPVTDQNNSHVNKALFQDYGHKETDTFKPYIHVFSNDLRNPPEK